MTPKSLMLIGAFGVVLSIAMSALDMGAQTTAVAFAAGAVFGKGYGIWEERGRRRKQ